MTKEKVLETIREFPDEFALEDLIEKLIFIEKVERGLRDLDEGKTRSHEEIKKVAKSWQA